MKVQFFGHSVSENGLEVDPSKKAIQKFPIPNSWTEVKSFLVLSLYYRRFFPQFAEIARFLHKDSETSRRFDWIPVALDAVEFWNWNIPPLQFLLFLVSRNFSFCTLTPVNLLWAPYLHKCRMAESELFSKLLNFSWPQEKCTMLHAASR